jgi:hypothetical protein
MTVSSNRLGQNFADEAESQPRWLQFEVWQSCQIGAPPSLHLENDLPVTILEHFWLSSPSKLKSNRCCELSLIVMDVAGNWTSWTLSGTATT